MPFKIICRRNGIYDVFNKLTGKHIFTETNPNAVFSKLSKMCNEIEYEMESE